jgi:WD40 repeat protein
MVDLHQFIKTFHIGIQRNVPHIYLSALPLSPKGSFISKWYMELYPGTLKVIEGGLQDWPTESQASWPWRGRGYLDSVDAFAFSLDGNWAASGSYDNLIRIWNMKTGELIAGPFEGHSASVECLAFSPNGHQLASGGGYDDDSIKIWDTTTGRLVAGPFKAHHNTVSSLAYSPNGRHVASGSANRMIHIWEVETGELVAESNTGSGAAQSIAYSAEGCRIAYVTNDSMIGIWNVENEELSVAPFCVRRSQSSCIAFSPDGSLIACGNWDSTIEIWDATNQELLVSLRTGASWVEAVAFSPDGTRLLSGSQDNSVRIWDVKTGEQIAGPFQGHVSSVIAVAFLHDNDHFVTGSLDKMVRLWNLREDNKQVSRL